ncbi:hypothetical protein ACQP00_28420 [Dactylosporangium sp. CS-047395]|uniref:hypothetical protein n=1 Tax=Dactylosporangium sp. CS-047395 TaxID=3239936 RepID=UPI003D94F051
MGAVRDDGLVEVGAGGLTVVVGGAAPASLSLYKRQAELVEDFPGAQTDGFSLVAVRDEGDWPRLVVTQRYSPAGGGFAPGVLLVPKRRQVFIGAGSRLLAYEARGGTWRRQWEDRAEGGFWQWRRHGKTVLMSAELELAAWTCDGRKLWSTFVEPPWSYRVDGGTVTLDVMGAVRTLELRTSR